MKKRSDQEYQAILDQHLRGVNYKSACRKAGIPVGSYGGWIYRKGGMAKIRRELRNKKAVEQTPALSPGNEPVEMPVSLAHKLVNEDSLAKRIIFSSLEAQDKIELLKIAYR